jgi:hypothetical protein
VFNDFEVQHPIPTALLNAAATVRLRKVRILRDWARHRIKPHQTQVVFREGISDTPMSRTRSVTHPSPRITTNKVVFVITVDEHLPYFPAHFNVFPSAIEEVVLLFKRGHPDAPWDPDHAYTFTERMGNFIAGYAERWADEREMVRSVTIVNSEAVPTPPWLWPEPPVGYFASIRAVVEDLVVDFQLERLTFSYLSLDEYERKVGTRQFFIEADPTYTL